MWKRFLNWLTGMTEEEREVYRLQEQIARLKREVRWNREAGLQRLLPDLPRLKYITQLEQELKAAKKQLPKGTVLGPKPGFTPEMNALQELEENIEYLHKTVLWFQHDSRLPVAAVNRRLYMLEKQRDFVRDQFNISLGWTRCPTSPSGWRHPSGAWGPPVTPFTRQAWWGPPTPAGWQPPPTGQAVPIAPPGWGPPTGCPASPPPASGWGPPSGAAVPISPPSSGDAVPMSGPFGSPRKRHASPMRIATIRTGRSPRVRRRDPRSGRFVK